MDQRNCIKKFCVKYEIKCASRFKMLTVAFGESTMSRTQVQLRYYRFKQGREDARPNRPCTSTIDENIEAIKKMIWDNRRITIRDHNFLSHLVLLYCIFHYKLTSDHNQHVLCMF